MLNNEGIPTPAIRFSNSANANEFSAISAAREQRSVATDVRRWTRASIMGIRLLTSAATKNTNPHPSLITPLD